MATHESITSHWWMIKRSGFDELLIHSRASTDADDPIVGLAIQIPSAGRRQLNELKSRGRNRLVSFLKCSKSILIPLIATNFPLINRDPHLHCNSRPAFSSSVSQPPLSFSCIDSSHSVASNPMTLTYVDLMTVAVQVEMMVHHQRGLH